MGKFLENRKINYFFFDFAAGFALAFALGFAFAGIFPPVKHFLKEAIT